MSGKEPWEDGLQELPREIEPARDLWPGIARRIGETVQGTGPAAGASARSRWNWRSWPVELVAAAAAVVVFVAGWGVARLSVPGEQSPPGAVAADASHRELDAEYEAAAKRVLETLDSSGVDPQTAAQLRADLAVLDDAVQGIRGALEERPSDPRLEKQLTAEVRRRNYVLQRIAEIQIAGLHLGGNE